MISTDRASSALPWLAGAVALLYIVLLVARFSLPPAKIGVQVFVHPAPVAN